MITTQIYLAHRILSGELLRQPSAVYGISVSYEILAEGAILE